MKNDRIPTELVALAGEFAVLSRLALSKYVASMALGNTKNIDILVSDPKTKKFYQLEVKTTLQNRKRSTISISKDFGRFVCKWIMDKKHENISSPEIWYCFVSIEEDTKEARYFVVPSKIVATYIKEEHKHWRINNPDLKETNIRTFRIGFDKEKYKVTTPTAEKYENNWKFIEEVD
jgi:hypothetical protein